MANALMNTCYTLPKIFLWKSEDEKIFLHMTDQAS